MWLVGSCVRWLGHVARMDFDRLPHRMLSAWVPHKRPIGAPRLTYGRSMVKAMDVFDLDPSHWHELAADRVAWRTMLGLCAFFVSRAAARACADADLSLSSSASARRSGGD